MAFAQSTRASVQARPTASRRAGVRAVALVSEESARERGEGESPQRRKFFSPLTFAAGHQKISATLSIVRQRAARPSSTFFSLPPLSGCRSCSCVLIDTKIKRIPSQFTPAFPLRKNQFKNHISLRLS
jgi:hypothetical protein